MQSVCKCRRKRVPLRDAPGRVHLKQQLIALPYEIFRDRASTSAVNLLRRPAQVSVVRDRTSCCPYVGTWLSKKAPENASAKILRVRMPGEACPPNSWTSHYPQIWRLLMKAGLFGQSRGVLEDRGIGVDFVHRNITSLFVPPCRREYQNFYPAQRLSSDAFLHRSEFEFPIRQERADPGSEI
jgi:hypothetical protein